MQWSLGANAGGFSGRSDSGTDRGCASAAPPSSPSAFPVYFRVGLINEIVLQALQTDVRDACYGYSPRSSRASSIRRQAMMKVAVRRETLCCSAVALMA